jgi:hypothetical protein
MKVVINKRMITYINANSSEELNVIIVKVFVGNSCGKE